MVIETFDGIYLHAAYATDAAGSDFSLTWFDGALYLGNYSDSSQTESTNPAMYRWHVLGETELNGEVTDLDMIEENETEIGYLGEVDVDLQADSVENAENAQTAAAYTDAAVEGLVPMTGHAEGSIANFEDLLIKDLVTDINPVQDLSGGNPSPTNICPISGFAEAKISRTSTNLCDEVFEAGGLNGVSGQPATIANRVRTKNFNPCKGGESYYIYCGTEVALRVFWYDITKTFINRTGNVRNEVVTAPSNAYYFKLNTEGTAYGETYRNDISMNYPSTDTSYHAYTGNVYTIDLGRTVYKGTLDVTTGLLTVTCESITFDGSNDEGWNGTATDSGTGIRRFYTTKSYAPNNSIVACDSYVIGTSASAITQQTDGIIIWDSGRVGVSPSWAQGMTLAQFKTELANRPFQIVKELATPLTYQLTPTQIATLNGTNNVLSSTGEVSIELVAIRDDIEKIEEVSKLASDTAQYFWYTSTGADTGAHITEVSQEEWNDSTSPNYHKGGNLLARSNGIAVRDGLTDLATFSNTGVAVLQNGNEVASFGSTVRIGESTDSNVVIGDNEVIIKDSNTPLSRFNGEGLYVGLNGRMDLGVRVGIGGEGTLSSWSTLGNLDASISNASAGEQGKTGYFTVSNGAGSDGWYGKTLTINNYFREACKITLHSQRDGILTNFPTLRSQVKAEADIISLDADLIKLSSAGALFSTTEATTATLTINGMSNLSGQTLTVTNAGYVPLGIVGTRCNYTSGQTGARNIYLCYLSSSSVGSATITYAVRNLDSAQNKGTIQFYILWVRADAV